MKSNSGRIVWGTLAISVAAHLLFFSIEGNLFSSVKEKYVEIPVSLDTPVPVGEGKSIPEMEQPDSFKEKGGPGVSTGTRFHRSNMTDRFIEYLSEVIHANRFEPENMKYANLIGNVMVGFTVESDGSFHAIRVLSSSGDPVLDATAVRAIAALSGRVKRPSWTGTDPISAAVVVKYQHDL